MINVKLEKFEGPLSLLLKMIEAEKLDITEVSLAKIADEYVEYIKNCQGIDPEMIADFLVLAAKLLYIKSRALLPYLFPAEEPEVEELERQLKMYREFLEAMKKVEEILAQKRFMFAPVGRNLRKILGQEDKFFSPPKKLQAKDLSAVFQDFIAYKKIARLEEKTIEYVINIEEKILGLEQTLLEKIKFSFNEFLSKAKSKTEIIVSFLAVLELMKQKHVAVDQIELFSEIIISRKELN